MYLGDHKRIHTWTIGFVLYAFYAFPSQQPTIIKVHMIKVTSLWTSVAHHIKLSTTTSLIGHLRRDALVFLLSLLSPSVYLSCSRLPFDVASNEYGRKRESEREWESREREKSRVNYMHRETNVVNWEHKKVPRPIATKLVEFICEWKLKFNSHTLQSVCK